MSEEEKNVQPQVMVILKDGNKVVFDTPSHEQFKSLHLDMEDWDQNHFIFLGPNCLMRQDLISSFYYFPEGYNVG